MSNTAHTYPRRWPLRREQPQPDLAVAVAEGAPLDEDWRDEIPDYIGEFFWLCDGEEDNDHDEP